MKKIDQIVELLGKEELNSNEIAERLPNIKKNMIRVYLHKLEHKNIIERTNNRIPFKYKKALTPIELLKQLYEIINKNKEFVKNLPESKKKLIRKIENRLKEKSY